MSDKLMLIDGNSIANRAFYGLPILTNSQGLYTNAVYGFLNIFFKLIEEEHPQYVGIAFDLKAPTLDMMYLLIIRVQEKVCQMN